MGATYAVDALKAAVIIWQPMDFMDFAGPAEVISHATRTNKDTGKSEQLVHLTVASRHELTGSHQRATLARDMDIKTLISKLDAFDILIIPGGAGFTATNVPKEPELIEAIKTFVALPAKGPQHPRTLMSICTGAFFLAQAEVLGAHVATTHYACLGELQKLCDSTKQGTKIVRQHYVDLGIVDKEKNLQIITGGGITSGFDATLYLLKLRFGQAVAQTSISVMDYSWREEMTPNGFAPF